VLDKAAIANCACKVRTAFVERTLRFSVGDGIRLAVDDIGIRVGNEVKVGVMVAGSIDSGLEVSVNVFVKMVEEVKLVSGVSVATDVFVFVGDEIRVFVGRGGQVDVIIGVRVGGRS